MNLPRTLLHLFQVLAVAAVIYLIVFSARRIKRGDAIRHPAVRLFIVTATAALFHALITSHKDIYYMAHLAPWFALCVGIMLNDALGLIEKLRNPQRPSGQMLNKAIAALVVIAVIAFALQLARQNRRYVREVRNPDLASFEELTGVLRSVVPDEVCPVAIKSPVLWLAFPEYDRCFATIEERMADNVDIDGKNYAVLMPAAYHKNRLLETRELDAKYHFLGELKNTPYGAIRVYYTGTNPNYLALQPKNYHFFGQHRGYVSEAQVARASEVWSARFDNIDDNTVELGLVVDAGGVLIQPKQKNSRGKSIDLWQVDLKPETIYRLSLNATSTDGKWEVAVVDRQTGALLHQERFGESIDLQPVEGLFKAAGSGHVKLVVQPLERETSKPLRISRISISEIPPG
jgi:hypothetical protein